MPRAEITLPAGSANAKLEIINANTNVNANTFDNLLFLIFQYLQLFFCLTRLFGGQATILLKGPIALRPYLSISLPFSIKQENISDTYPHLL
jgi:hypothetical protein